ncbi:hypothetical protein D3C80_1509800 [compost metagenome]
MLSQPFFRYRIDAFEIRQFAVHHDQIAGRQLCGHGFERGFDHIAGFVFRNQRHDILRREQMLGIFQRHQVFGFNGRIG